MNTTERIPALAGVGNLLEVRVLSRSFNGFQAVRDVSFDVPSGSITAMIGPNGAGKTTMFNLLTGLLRPDAGTVMFKGRDVTALPPHRRCRLGMGRSFQRTNIFPSLTVGQNVQAAFVAHRGRGWEFWRPSAGMYGTETDELLESVGLRDRANEKAQYLSHGDQKQLELGIALALDPEIMLLDEPTAGMSIAETQKAIALIGRLARERHLTLLFTEHDMDVVFSIADRIVVLHHGSVLAIGKPAEVKQDPEVRRVYLGTGHS
ncbi:MAG: ABC transporter ATP-binding protein [Alphaproteobacteria bacterium]|nr:ABC transporter ATP-binding protein [Alphaproteobacteria bacterium]MBM3732271.1 ABC transporter ATP-binding protein [Acidimicrobiia bacterium]